MRRVVPYFASEAAKDCKGERWKKKELALKMKFWIS
jgi:hypothetical protein